MKIPFLAVLIAIAVVIAIVSGFVAFYPLFSQATSSSKDTADSYASEVSIKVSKFVEQLLASAPTYTFATGRAFRLGAAVRSNNDSVVKWVCDFVQQAPLIYIVYYTDTTGFLLGRVNTLNVSIPARPNNTIVSYYDGSKHLAEFRYIPDSNPTFDSPPDFVQTTTFNHSTRPYTAPMMRGFGWIAPFVDYSKQFADFGIGGPLIDPVTGQTYGIYGAFFRAVVVIDYLKTLRVAKTGQAFLVDASSQKYIGGTSSDPSVKTVVAGGVSSVVLTTPSDVQEPISRRAIDALGSQLYSCLSCSMRVGSGGDMLFVSVSALQDAYGLDLRVVVAIPSDDFLGPINSGMRTGLAAAGGAIAGFLVLVALTLHLLLIPLKRLEERLYASSTLVVEGEELGRESFISEIANIQNASTELQRELKKVKAFLPQSVLRRLEQPDEDDEDADTETASAGMAGSTADDALTPKAASPVAQHPSSLIRRGSAATSHRSSEGLKRANKQGINGDMTIATRRVTMLAINLGGLLKLSATASPMQVQSVLARCMDVILSNVNTAKGVVESVSGDHFVVSLNASTNCGTHATRAAALILSLSQMHRSTTGVAAACGAEVAVSFAELMENIQVGCATSNALCGNFGTDRLRRFSVLGSVVNHAFHLMTRCRAYQVPALTTAGSADLMGLEYDMQHVGLEQLPHGSTPAIVSTVVRKKEAADDEWMYQLNKDRAEGTNSVRDFVEQEVNRFFELLVDGKISDARQVLNSLAPNHPLVARCAAALPAA